MKDENVESIEITKEEYEKACRQKDLSDITIKLYHSQRRERFNRRMKENPIFKSDELCFSAFMRCQCGAGLAYPKECWGDHYWFCAAVLMGTSSENIIHDPHKPFAYYDIKSEDEPSAKGATTRKLKGV